jgi:hypothetical protein
MYGGVEVQVKASLVSIESENEEFQEISRASRGPFLCLCAELNHKFPDTYIATQPRQGMTYMTFIGPRIVTYFYSKSKYMHQFPTFILFLE